MKQFAFKNIYGVTCVEIPFTDWRSAAKAILETESSETQRRQSWNEENPGKRTDLKKYARTIIGHNGDSHDLDTLMRALYELRDYEVRETNSWGYQDHPLHL